MITISRWAKTHQERPAARRESTGQAGWSRRILVGVAPSPAGNPALEWAIDEAGASGAELLVCHAYTREHLVRPLPDGAGTVGEARARRRLDTAVATARRRLGPRRVVGELRLGDPATVLVKVSVSATILVLGRGRHVEQAARLTGSTAPRVAAHAGCPVVVCPLTSGVRGPFAGHVVVGMDDTQAGLAALEFGFRYAAERALPLAAVHVTPQWPGDFWTDDEVLQTYFATEPEALTQLSVHVEPWHLRYPEVAVKRARYGGDPVRGLLRAAGGARLLVVGDRRRGGLRRLMLGSVSQGVVGNADCPIAVVHPDQSTEGAE